MRSSIASELLDGAGECTTALCAGGQAGELAFVTLFEGVALGIGAGEVALDLRIVEAGVEVGEVALGQLAECDFRTGRATSGRPLGDGLFWHSSRTGHTVGAPHRGNMWRSAMAPARPNLIAGGDRCCMHRIVSPIEIKASRSVSPVRVCRLVALTRRDGLLSSQENANSRANAARAAV